MGREEGREGGREGERREGRMDVSFVCLFDLVEKKKNLTISRCE